MARAKKPAAKKPAAKKPAARNSGSKTATKNAVVERLTDGEPDYSRLLPHQRRALDADEAASARSANERDRLMRPARIVLVVGSHSAWQRWVDDRMTANDQRAVPLAIQFNRAGATYTEGDVLFRQGNTYRRFAGENGDEVLTLDGADPEAVDEATRRAGHRIGHARTTNESDPQTSFRQRRRHAFHQDFHLVARDAVVDGDATNLLRFIGKELQRAGIVGAAVDELLAHGSD